MMMDPPPEASGLLMSVIRALSATECNEQRDREKEKLDKEFKICDARLEQLIGDEEKSIKDTMEYFTRISGRASVAQEKVRQIKQTLQTCKELLFCNRDQLKTLWLEGMEHQQAVMLFAQVDMLRTAPRELQVHMEKKNFKKATELLLESNRLFRENLKGVDALRDVRQELENEQNNLCRTLLNALTEEIYHKNTEVVFERRLVKHGIGPRFSRGASGRRSKDNESRWATRPKNGDSDLPRLGDSGVTFEGDVSSSDASQLVSTVVDSLAQISQIPFAVKELRSGVQRELLSALERVSSHILTYPAPLPTTNGSSRNQPPPFRLMTHPQNSTPVISQATKLMIEDLLDTLFEMFRLVVASHKTVLSQLRKHCPPGSGVQVYETSEVWGKVQAVLQLTLSDYVESQSIPMQQRRYHSLLSSSPEHAHGGKQDLNVFFARRRPPARTTCGSLFSFEHTAHALKMKALNREQRLQYAERSLSSMSTSSIDGSHLVTESVRTLVCQPSSQNITALFNPLLSFVSEIEKDLGFVKGTHCTLHVFLTEHVKMVFLGQIQSEMESSIDLATRSLDAWNSTTMLATRVGDSSRSKPLLQGTVLVMNCLSQLGELMMSMTLYAPHFLALVERILSHYLETCEGGYRGIVQPESEDKRVISGAWAEDRDIAGFLKSLPSWSQLQIASQGPSNVSILDQSVVSMDVSTDEAEERSQDIMARHQREADLLMGNLAAGTSTIPPHEIISDVSQVKSLAHLQESMEWFAESVGAFVMYLQSTPSQGFKKALEKHIEFFRKLINSFQSLADTCLLVLHLELRVHCFFHLLPLVRDLAWAALSSEKQDPDREILQLNKDLQSLQETLADALPRNKLKYIFEGVGHLCGAILKNAMQGIQRMNENGIKRMSRNIVSLQQTLTSITLSRELSLDSARQFYELLHLSAEEILGRILEHGPQYGETEYIHILDVKYRSQLGAEAGDANVLRKQKETLSEILGEVGVTV